MEYPNVMCKHMAQKQFAEPVAVENWVDLEPRGPDRYFIRSGKISIYGLSGKQKCKMTLTILPLCVLFTIPPPLISSQPQLLSQSTHSRTAQHPDKYTTECCCLKAGAIQCHWVILTAWTKHLWRIVLHCNSHYTIIMTSEPFHRLLLAFLEYIRILHDGVTYKSVPCWPSMNAQTWCSQAKS